MQELYLVIGGELIETHEMTFKDPSALDVVGVFADLESARQAWKASSWSMVDNAHMRYFVIPLADALAGKSRITSVLKIPVASFR